MKATAVSAIFLTLCFTSVSTAELVVNEVLANEPAGETSLEWLELYNNSAGLANFAFYELRVTSGTQDTVFHPVDTVGGGDYLIFCRDAIRYEEHWGDSSGVWSDGPLETYDIHELPIRLSNSGGRVALYDLTTLPASLVSEMVWSESGLDGHSWERLHWSDTTVGQSLDPSGSTPGSVNSLTPMPRDLALEQALPSADNGLTLIGFRIVNRGLTDVNDAILELYEFDSTAFDSLGDLVGGELVGPVDSGYAVLLVGQYQLSGIYERLLGSLVVSGDDRPANNRLAFTAPGAAYPPVVLSELLANPDPSTGSEWVEVKNISDSSFGLSSWQIGDSSGLTALNGAPLIAPNEYVVFVQDSTSFLIQYPLFSGQMFQPPSWREYNNGSDSVRLVDALGIQSDHFYYTDIYSANHTWCRGETGEYEGRWGRSEDSGGTPGEANRVRFSPEGSQSLRIAVDPQIISPDGDGRDDSTVIRIQASKATSYILKLYDCHGRLVRTLEDEATDLRQAYVWRGETDSGAKLPIGIYVLYFEAVNVESGRKTIVVAR